MKLWLLASLLALVTGYKIAVFTPTLSRSQVQFNERIASTLANAGHDVTMIFLTYYEDMNVSDVKVPDNVKIYNAKGIVSWITKAEMEKKHASVIYKDVSMMDPQMIEMMKLFTRFMGDGCRMLLKNKEFLQYMKDQHFDIAISHMYNMCPVGIIEYAKIPSWIWMNSGLLADHVADVMGVPIIPSYVAPIMQESTDRMGFIERTKSVIGHLLVKVLFKLIIAPAETRMFRDEFGEDFPDLLDVAAKCPLVMVNTNDLYDNPRPLLAKVINIGGLGVGFETAKPLKPEFEKIVNGSKGVVVFSFGSVAAAHEMPSSWKNAFLDAFSKFPEYQFFVRYEGSDLNDRLPTNVHIHRWLPQKDLLLNPKTKGFITHGGYNSLQEAISAGVPLLTIPLFGDQPKNALLAQKHGFAVAVQKSQMESDHIVAALKKLIGDPSYKKSVKRISDMVRRQPIKPAELLVKWTEFVAEFQTLDNLVPAGQHLNFFQYHSLDVICFLSTVTAVVLYIVLRIFRFLLSFVCSLVTRRKKEKTN